MHANATLIQGFYEAFARGDGAAMAACYRDDATFSDPVFAGLKGSEPGAMWRMLTSQAKDLVITFRDVQADETSGSAHWEATYTFSATGRKVHNVIDAKFRFVDGKIAEHVDTFDLYAWTRMAIGPMGTLLGWSPVVQGPLRKKARAGLMAWMAKNGLS
jgi:ketosteroid isomerase-like protein